MGKAVRALIRQAKRAFADRNVDMARDLVRQDDVVDNLNQECFQRAIEIGDEVDRREWAMTMMLVARALERIGDNAVDVGEQVAFLVTGLFREFEDASHPGEDVLPAALLRASGFLTPEAASDSAQECLTTRPLRMSIAWRVRSIASSSPWKTSFQRITSIGSMPPSKSEATACAVDPVALVLELADLECFPLDATSGRPKPSSARPIARAESRTTPASCWACSIGASMP